MKVIGHTKNSFSDAEVSCNFFWIVNEELIRIPIFFCLIDLMN